MKKKTDTHRSGFSKTGKVHSSQPTHPIRNEPAGPRKAIPKPKNSKSAVSQSSPSPISTAPVEVVEKKVKAPKAPKAPKTSSASGVESGGGEAVCREVACEGLSTTGGYCRMHYIKNWKKIKRKELILREGKLNQYIEELVAKYPDKYIEAIRQDLASDKDFAKVIYDLDLDEGLEDFEMEGESVDSLIDSIKRDFEDEGEGTF